MDEESRLLRLLASVEREEYEEIQRPTGAFVRQLFAEEPQEPAADEEADENEEDEESQYVVEDSPEEMPVTLHLFDDTDDLEEMPLHIRLNENIGTRRNGKAVFISKDKSMLWDLQPTTQNRTRRRNILRMRMGHATQTSRQASTPQEVWSLFFTEQMIADITTNTNIWIEQNKQNFARERDCKTTTPSELRAVLGLLYMAGRMKSSHENLKDLYDTDGTGVEIFSLVMSRNRLSFLLRALRFDNITTRQERKFLDKFTAVRDLFEEFNQNCQNNYVVSEFVTIDEMLESFRGRCSFRVYMKNKPAKYGIKIFSLACAKTFYTSNMEVYVGKQPEGPFEVDNSGMGVVERLVGPIAGTNRNVTVDNWFTSIPLCEKLLMDYELTLVGTVKNNKKEIPPIFLEKKGRPVGSSMFGFKNGCTLVSYQAKKNKNVLLISSMHDDDSVDSVEGSKTYGKPEIILFYNSSKGGVDTVDKYKETYSVARVTNRWPMRMFYSMMDIAGINSFIVLKGNLNEPNMVRRNFLKELAKGLCKEHMLSRMDVRSTPTWIKRRIRQVLGVQDPQRQLALPEDTLSGRCYSCDWKKNRLSKTRCLECRLFICREHTAPARCVHCASEEANEEAMEQDSE